MVLKLGKSKQPVDRQRPAKKKQQYTKEKYYVPLYNTPKCTYTGKKRGRKSKEEKSNLEYIKKTGLFVLDFD
tara:strand:- start:1737 stop:1952 length:216 start_codon:yes stop_codon:yes gene_type:complete